MGENAKLDLTTEVVKQQITLASGVIGAVVAFRAGKGEGLLAPASLLAASIAAGVFTLMCLAGCLPWSASEGKTPADPTAQPLVSWSGASQNVLFVVGMIWLVVAAF